MLEKTEVGKSRIVNPEKQATLWRNRQHGETGNIVEKQATWRNRQHCGETGNIVHKTKNED